MFREVFDAPQFTKDEDGRIGWVLNLKTIGILSVVLGHITSPLGAFIFSWHMPLFFFLAGIFLTVPKSLKYFAKASAIRLLVPYYVFALFGLLFEIIKRVALNRDSLDIFSELVGIFLWMDYPSLSHHYGLVLWFLSALFVARFVVVGLLKIARNNSLIMFLLALPLCVLGCRVDLPFAIDEALTVAPWVALGIVFRQHYQASWRYQLALALVVLLLVPMQSLNMSMKTYESLPQNFMWALSCIVLAIFLSKQFRANDFTRLWGEETMAIFVFHVYTNNVASLFGERFALHWSWVFVITLLQLHVLLLLKKRLSHWRLVRII